MDMTDRQRALCKAAMDANATAQQAGFLAGARGKPCNPYPHSAATGLGRAWVRGWKQGRGVYVLNTSPHLIQPADEWRQHRRTCWLVAAVAWAFVLVMALPFLGWLASLFW